MALNALPSWFSSFNHSFTFSNNTYTRANFNSLPGISNIPADNNNSNYVYKLGSALTQGTVVFQCNMQQKYTGAGGTNFTNSYVEWLVYHRSSGSGNWTNANSSRINDINNSNQPSSSSTHIE